MKNIKQTKIAMMMVYTGKLQNILSSTKIMHHQTLRPISPTLLFCQHSKDFFNPSSRLVISIKRGNY